MTDEKQEPDALYKAIKDAKEDEPESSSQKERGFFSVAYRKGEKDWTDKDHSAHEDFVEHSEVTKKTHDEGPHQDDDMPARPSAAEAGGGDEPYLKFTPDRDAEGGELYPETSNFFSIFGVLE